MEKRWESLIVNRLILLSSFPFTARPSIRVVSLIFFQNFDSILSVFLYRMRSKRMAALREPPPLFMEVSQYAKEKSCSCWFGEEDETRSVDDKVPFNAICNLDSSLKRVFFYRVMIFSREASIRHAARPPTDILGLILCRSHTPVSWYRISRLQDERLT